MTDLEGLRQEIKAKDREIIQLIEERVETARKIGAVKAREGKPIKNYHVEEQVLQRMKDLAGKHGLLDSTAENITETLIQEAVRGQEKHRRNNADNSGDNYLIVGGEGKMGRWFQDYLRQGGTQVSTVDQGKTADYTTLPALNDYDAVLISTPVHITPQIISELRQRSPDATIADITSVKAPVKEELIAAKEAGLNVTSFHPMFDDTVKTLNGKNVIIASLGVRKADQRIKKLFANTAANISTIPFDEHDQHIVYTLGLPHIASLVFGSVLENTDTDFDTYQSIGGQTFLKHGEAAREVFNENPAVYHAIQHYSEGNQALFDTVRDALDDVESAAQQQVPAKMQSIMKRGSNYFNVFEK